MTLHIIELIKETGGSYDEIRNYVFKQNILSSYMSDGRMIFHTSKNTRFNKIKDLTDKNPNIPDNLWMECNGIILDCSDFSNIKPLVIPQCSFISQYNKNIMTTNIYDGLYDIYKIEDGTIINLYYYEKLNSWRIATTRGIDMNNCKFNNITYIDILNEILNKKDIELNTFFGSLNKELCYTFNIKHQSMHKFDNVDGINDNIWFIQAVETSTLELHSDIDILGITKQSLVEDTANFMINKNNEKSLSNYLTKKTVNLGYILKSKNTKLTKIHSNILIESTLMRKIRNLLYDSKYIKMAKDLVIDKETVIIISAYLNINNRDLFIQLFPNYNYMYAILTNITNEQINNIIKYHNKKRCSNNDDSSFFDDITLYLYNNIHKLYNINMINPIYLNQVINNYLINENNITIYVNLYKSMTQL